jgi:hypothetical protein
MEVGRDARDIGARPSSTWTLLDGAADNIAGFLNGDFEVVALRDAIGQINAARWMLDQMELSVS